MKSYEPPRAGPLQWTGSILFNVWMVVSALTLGLACVPLMLVGRRFTLAAIRIWSGMVISALKLLCGVTVEIRGRENLPETGVLIAAKHQGMLDTVAPFQLLSAPAIVLKQELLRIPIYGWYAKRAGMIAIDREGAAKTLRALIKAVRTRFDEGRQIIIFPEGTRVEPYAAPDYKPGIAALYRELGVPCVPLATNSGLHWPAHGLIRHRGKVVFEFLPAIPANLKRAAFMHELETRVEAATRRLMDEDRAGRI